MVFNVLASNNDDHTKNHAFLMAEDGTWNLSPAYDVTFAYNPQSKVDPSNTSCASTDGSPRSPQPTFTRSANSAACPGTRSIIRDVEDAISRWPVHARDAGVPRARIDEVAARLATVALT